MRRLPLDTPEAVDASIGSAAKAIGRGEVVAFPTDTIYGLAVDPRNEAALSRLFDLKGRRSDQPVALIAGSLTQVERWLVLSPLARQLARSFWPGPLTLVLHRRQALAAAVSGPEGRVGVRIPAHELARRFALVSGHPLTATSANRSGHTPTASPDEVARQLTDLDVLLDGGLAPGGAPSTLVDASGDVPELLRDGAITWDRVLESLRSPSPRP